MYEYPRPIPTVGHVAPCPRRIRVVVDMTLVVDTCAARYVWEHNRYPRYYVPVGDMAPDALADENAAASTSLGPAKRFGLRTSRTTHRGGLLVFETGKLAGLARIDPRLDATWYEEDEQIFVHPRDPYVRVDALRSTRTVRVELNGAVLAESRSPVFVYETGLPTRHYLNRTDVDFTHLVRSDSVTACPYKGITSQYWSVRLDDTLFADLAWCYDFPTRHLLPIAGMVAFYDERVDVFIDGRRLILPPPRPRWPHPFRARRFRTSTRPAVPPCPPVAGGASPGGDRR